MGILNINKIIKNTIYIQKRQKFAVIIGYNPSDGARSPKLWNNAYKKLNKQVRMYPLDVDLKNMKKIFDFIKTNNFFIGGSITAPYKTQAIKYLDYIDDKSQKIGSINTILKKKNKLYGYNTDYYGSLESLKFFKSSQIKRVLIIGCGGAGKATILSAVKYFKKSKLYFFNRNKKKLSNYLKKIKIRDFEIINKYEFLLKLKKIDLVVNTSSVGFDSWIMGNKKFYNLKFFTPLSNLKNIKKTKNKNDHNFIKLNLKLINKNLLTTIKFFRNNTSAKVFDIVYNPNETILMKSSKLFYNNTINGDKMNLAQAIKAFGIVNKIKSKQKILNIMR